MKQKTKIHAEDGRQELKITREFELPLELLFKAFTEAELVAQWMGTKVLKLENRRQGAYTFETTDPKGNKHVFSGVIHDFVPEQKITRTFEMENTGFEPQLEFLEFEPLGEDRSKLTMHVVYRSVGMRDQILQLPFAQGINHAHNRIEDLMSRSK